MQSTTSRKLTEGEFWWPHPDAFNDLEVTDIEDGWQLSAPDDTELAAWLNYWGQDEEHHAIFQTIFVRALTEHANLVLDDLEQHGETEITDGCQSDREQAEVHCSGPQPKHESGSDSQST
jgi:hypothetical protein